VQRAKRLAALAAGVLALGGALAPTAALAGGSSSALGPARVGVRARARSAASHGPSVSAALASLLHAGAISEASYHSYYAAYVAAKGSLAKLSGTRKEELGAVLANVQAIAGAGELIPSRLPALFLTLERNRQWWTTESLLTSDERISFPESEIIWEHYPGQGIEIQWLATFGEANGYYLSGDENSKLRELLGEVIPLATQRAGGIAWEYMFKFDGGPPPWTSGLSQGTALQVLARAWSRFKEPADLAAAQQALGIFKTPPPQGVRVATPAGAMYAEYTYAPGDKILNGFIQALVGLYDYTAITKDPLGLALFEAGDAQARAMVPLYDTGAWSLYDQFGESDLNYHELLTEFLQHLCERTRKGSPATPAGAIATQIPGDQIYCTTAQRFTTDLRTPPVISLLSTKLPGGARAGVQVSLSKISTVTMTIRQGSRVVWTNRATVERGKPRLLWKTPAKGGTFTVQLLATDLAGNFSTASGTVLVSRH
jgi:D-glucuronyl C5-epimerase-like protein